MTATAAAGALLSVAGIAPAQLGEHAAGGAVAVGQHQIARAGVRQMLHGQVRLAGVGAPELRIDGDMAVTLERGDARAAGSDWPAQPQTASLL